MLSTLELANAHKQAATDFHKEREQQQSGQKENALDRWSDAKYLQLLRGKQQAAESRRKLHSQLGVAAENGRIADVQKLVKDPNMNINNTDYVLKHKVRKDSVKGKTIQTIELFSINQYTTPLYAAAVNGHFDVVQFLIEHGASINQQNDFGESAFMAACRGNHVSIAQYLLEQGGDLQRQDHKGNAALHSACHAGNLEIVKVLVEAGASISQKNKLGCTPLYLACDGGCVSVVSHLLEHGPNIELYNNNFITPFHCACRRGALEIVQILYRCGANPYLADRCGLTPFAAACREGHINVITFLGHCEIDLDRIDVAASVQTDVGRRRARLLGYMADLRLGESYDMKAKYDALRALANQRPVKPSEVGDRPFAQT